jgi:hypothetical protein
VGRRRSSHVAAVAVVAALATLPGCTADTAPAPPAEPSLTASVLQLRHEEATPTVHLHLVNTGDEPVDVASLRLGGPALSTPEAEPVPDDAHVLEPGELLTAPAEHEPPDCAAPDAPGVLVATLADGTSLEVGLDADGQQLVDWLVDGICGVQRLEESVRVRFLPRWRPGTVDGRAAMVGTLAIDRRGDGPAVEVLGVRGSVLLDLVMRPPSFTLPVAQDSARLEVALVPAGRCDGHALSQSRQTFLLSVFAQLAGEHEQRLVLPPRPAVQDRVLAQVRRSCGV